MKKHFILSMLLAVGMTVAAQTPWNGTVAEAYDGGDGTPENPYQIATAEQLARRSNWRCWPSKPMMALEVMPAMCLPTTFVSMKAIPSIGRLLV